ncbi:MAG: spore germination protein GerW family protein [Bacillota bacterium]|nr:spore germination protein GerW family protein [Bacillota bacterium]
MNLTENLKVLFEELEKFFKTETVVGEPIVVGNVTLIPIVNVSFGAGNGGGNGQDTKGNDGSGGGSGAGGKIEPNAIVVVKGDDVSVMSLNGKGPMDKIIAMVPEIIGKVKEKKEG